MPEVIGTVNGKHFEANHFAKAGRYVVRMMLNDAWVWSNADQACRLRSPRRLFPRSTTWAQIPASSPTRPCPTRAKPVAGPCLPPARQRRRFTSGTNVRTSRLVDIRAPLKAWNPSASKAGVAPYGRLSDAVDVQLPDVRASALCTCRRRRVARGHTSKRLQRTGNRGPHVVNTVSDSVSTTARRPCIPAV
jgi:hypothetical protein